MGKLCGVWADASARSIRPAIARAVPRARATGIDELVPRAWASGLDVITGHRVEHGVESTVASLAELGFKAFFQQQLSLEEWEACRPARIVAHQRSHQTVVQPGSLHSLPINTLTAELTVGDWVLMDESDQLVRALDRLSLFSRKAAGSEIREQRIAANVDTAFVVSSLDHDFNLSRLERYIVLVRDAGVEPVVVLSKLDVCDDPEPFIEAVRSIDDALMVVTINARDSTSASTLLPWVPIGDTVACLGSSGVGKSTLVNQLLGDAVQDTGSVREDDSKGRHTTSSRSLHRVPSAGLLIDTPGMRELQLSDVESGVRQTFADVEALATRCRFADCRHGSEPGCAVKAELAAGRLDERRVESYRKLLREQALNAETLHEKHERDRQLGRLFRTVKQHTKARKGGR